MPPVAELDAYQDLITWLSDYAGGDGIDRDLRDYRQADGELGYFQHAFRVYDREGEPCPTPGCGGRVARIVQSGRSTFFCPRCQR